MAKKLTDRIYRDGNELVVEDCEGNTVRIDLCCTDTSTDGGVEPPESDWCDVANSIANKIKATMGTWGDFLDDFPGITDLQLAIRLIQDNHMSVGRLADVLAYLSADRVAFDDIIWTDDGLLQLEQYIVCSAFEAINITGGAINAAWVSSFQNSLRNNPEIDRCNLQGWDAIADFIDLMGLEFWQLGAFEYSPAGSTLFWLGCECSEVTLPDCAEVAKTFDFENSAAEGYSILSGFQGPSLITGTKIPTAGLPEYGIPGSSSATSLGAYVRLDLNVKVAELRMKYRFRRYNGGAAGATAGVGVLLYCYDAANQLLFGKPLGGSIVAPQDTENIASFRISAAGACIHHAVLICNYASSDSAAYIQILDAGTFLTLQ